MASIRSGFVFFSFGKDKEFPTKTVYMAACSDSKHSIYDCPKCLKVYSTTYRVFIEKQMVISKKIFWVDDGKRKCKVFDENNWRCDDNDVGHGWESMRDGDYFSSVNKLEQISAIRYWWHYVKNMSRIK